MRMVRRFSMIRFYLDPRRQKTNKTTKKCVWCGWSSVRLKIGNFGRALTPCLNNSSHWYLKKVISQVFVISKRVSQWIMSSKISQDKKSQKSGPTNCGDANITWNFHSNDTSSQNLSFRNIKRSQRDERFGYCAERLVWSREGFWEVSNSMVGKLRS